MLGSDLQQARREAADRFYRVGMAALPEGWTYKHNKSLSGYAMLKTKHLVAPKPVTRKSLYIWLHECGHAQLHGRPAKKPRHVEEMEAEQFAHRVMREHGIPVPRSMTQRAQRYVAKRSSRPSAAVPSASTRPPPSSRRR